MAVSLNSPEDFQGILEYSTAAAVALRVAGRLMQQGLPAGVFLNVNVPYLKENELKGYQVTRQGSRLYRDALDARIDPRGKPYYWIGGEFPLGVEEEGTDYGAIRAGYVSITPLQLDLTAWEAMEDIRKWNWRE